METTMKGSNYCQANKIFLENKNPIMILILIELIKFLWKENNWIVTL